jgi:predicted amidohydrolase
MTGPLRVALGQIRVELGDVDGNLARLRGQLERAAAGGAALACFPELCLSGYLLSRADYTDALLDAVESAQRALADDARRHGLAIVYGAPVRRGRELVNAVVYQPPDGERLDYAKTHLDIKERAVFARGDELIVGPAGIGLACCYDLAFPEPSRVLVLRGARLLIVPMAWEVARGFVMQRVVAARAVENVAHVVCVNQAGESGELRFLGASCAIDPLGAPATTLGAGEELGFADVDLEWVDRLRAGHDERTYPLLDDRRPDLYADLHASASDALVP